MDIVRAVKKDIRHFSDLEKSKILQRFFKTGKGEYGEGDKFMGVKVPESRSVAVKYFSDASLGDIEKIIESHFHEDRLTGLIMLVKKFEIADERDKKKIFEFYISHVSRINNWDLVDLTAPNIAGEWLLEKDKKIIYEMAKSKNIWERRIAIVSTFAFIRKNNFDDTLAIAKILLDDKEDLIHKSVGWMLREVGKRKEKALVDFLEKYSAAMPRTALRYAIERFNEKRRLSFLKKI